MGLRPYWLPLPVAGADGQLRRRAAGVVVGALAAPAGVGGIGVVGAGVGVVIGYSLLVILHSAFRIPHSAISIPPPLPPHLPPPPLALSHSRVGSLPVAHCAAGGRVGGGRGSGGAGEQGSRGGEQGGEKESKRGRALGFFTSHYSLLTTHFLLLTFYLLLLSSAYPAWLGRWPIGGQPTADRGAARLAQELVDAPYGTVLYDHWYSWHWRYHFIDTGVYVSWFPHPAGLVEDVTVFGTDGRYLILPLDKRATPVLRTLHEANIATHPIAAAGEMVLYQLAMNNEQ